MKNIIIQTARDVFGNKKKRLAKEDGDISNNIGEKTDYFLHLRTPGIRTEHMSRRAIVEKETRKINRYN
jgi:hypothetical protein